jgi:hypothetical protein
MKLAAIYNVWDGLELLPYSIRSIRDHVDVVIIVYQERSNWGEFNPDVDYWLRLDSSYDASIKMEPNTNVQSTRYAMKFETAKRQAGINLAVKMGCTHFIGMDTDELYRPVEFEAAKIRYEAEGMGATAAPIRVYYKSPTLAMDKLDSTLVPFICPLPARTGIKKTNIKVDLTRCTSERYSIMPDITMHHYSWVRRNGIESKTRNSTARININTPEIIKEWREAGEGTVLNKIHRGKTLIRVPNEFNLPEWQN